MIDSTKLRLHLSNLNPNNDKDKMLLFEREKGIKREIVLDAIKELNDMNKDQLNTNELFMNQNNLFIKQLYNLNYKLDALFDDMDELRQRISQIEERLNEHNNNQFSINTRLATEIGILSDKISEMEGNSE